MRKYYYVCPRCGRCYKRYIPRRKAKCGFCSTVWKTRGAKGTRSAFSWTATLVFLAAIVVVAFLIGRELGVLSKSSVVPGAVDVEESRFEETDVAPLTESVEDASNEEIVETPEGVEELEATSGVGNAESDATSETSEDAAFE
ncbi:MAG: hypothetical protein IKK39_13035 [Thermoguttaceae bacterium]|nr:hypothetical protein [Thermoguttaceae bacterium]MBR4104969.1 hypothetical protein [Thermoguttaceae bacterium]